MPSWAVPKCWNWPAHHLAASYESTITIHLSRASWSCHIGPVGSALREKDSLLDLSHQEKLEKAYPHAEFQIFREAGHNMLGEFPQKAAKVFRPFLDAPAEGEQ